jgi:hypothetical protein
MTKFIVGSIGTILSVLIILFGSSLLEGIILWVSYPSLIKLFPILGCYLPLSISYWNSAMIMALLNLIIGTISKLWKK